MTQAATANPTLDREPSAWSRVEQRERAVDAALESAATSALLLQAIDARTEQGVAHLASIDASLRELLVLAKGNRK
jgi:hypothetical protein